MASGHSEKFFTKLLIGFAFIIGATFLIFFYFVNVYKPLKSEDWYFWGLGTAILFNTGLYFMISAAVHKTKNDMIRRQQSREMQKSRPADH
ncbi:MAG: hypothetical protein E6H07_14650 [Bacteroidetes bacterium]|nr:MAG: hypothetical protein E6H07_14650 [Bacteroidota bacterium]